MEERICGTDGFSVWSERPREWQMVRTKVMTVKWYVRDEVNQEESEHNEVDGMKKGADSPIRWWISERVVAISLLLLSFCWY